MQKKDTPNVKTVIINLLEKNSLFKIDIVLPDLIKALADTRHTPQSKIQPAVNKILQLIETMKKTDLGTNEGKGKYLVWLTSVAEELQALQRVQAQDLVLLGKKLLQKIHTYLEGTYDHPYLKCTLERETSVSYKVSNIADISMAAGLLPVISAPLLNGVVAPFSQEETKALGFIPVGMKNRIGEANKEFGVHKLADFVNRTVHRFQKPRIGSKHTDQFINVFQAEYTKTAGTQPGPNATGNVIYLIGVHGNAFNGGGMLRFLDQQAASFFENGGENVDKMVALASDYPGSQASGGKFATIQDLALDSMVLLVSHLLDKGVDPSQIICLGHSLGGAVLAEADHQLLAKEIVTTIISINSFAQLQKFAMDSPILGRLALGQYNIPASTYFQEHPRNRRFVRHTKDDEVIPLETHSLLADLAANKGGEPNEGILLEEGGHSLFVHDIKDVITMVSVNHLAFQRGEDQKLLHSLYSSLERIIRDHHVESSFTNISMPEFPANNPLTELQKEYSALLVSLGVKREDMSKEKVFGSLEKSRWNLKVLLGFIHNTCLELGKIIDHAESARRYFQRVDPVIAALMEVKKGLDALLNKNYLGSLPLSVEMLSHYKAVFEDHSQIQLPLQRPVEPSPVVPPVRGPSPPPVLPAAPLIFEELLRDAVPKDKSSRDKEEETIPQWIPPNTP